MYTARTYIVQPAYKINKPKGIPRPCRGEHARARRSFRYVIPSQFPRCRVVTSVCRTESTLRKSHTRSRLASHTNQTQTEKNTHTLKTNCYRLIFVPRNSQNQTIESGVAVFFGHTKGTYQHKQPPPSPHRHRR